MLKIYDPKRLVTSFLKRRGLDDMPVSAALQESINRLFGEALTPAQVVDRILNDVRAARRCRPARMDREAGRRSARTRSAIPAGRAGGRAG